MVVSRCINYSRDTNVVESIMSRIQKQAERRENDKQMHLLELGSVVLWALRSYQKTKLSNIMDSPSVHDSLSKSDFDKLTREVEQIDAHIERQGQAWYRILFQK